MFAVVPVKTVRTVAKPLFWYIFARNEEVARLPELPSIKASAPLYLRTLWPAHRFTLIS